MHIRRGIFQTLGTGIMVAIACVWLFVEESERTIPIVLLVVFFTLLSFEYLREGFAQKKP